MINKDEFSINMDLIMMSMGAGSCTEYIISNSNIPDDFHVKYEGITDKGSKITITCFRDSITTEIAFGHFPLYAFNVFGFKDKLLNATNAEGIFLSMGDDLLIVSMNCLLIINAEIEVINHFDSLARHISDIELYLAERDLFKSFNSLEQ